ncbi:hypothetical protein [Ottowia massiliensis]|uniref:hypothetical protein n=1 Tax=Ottowia massiliensis TaxID=2045302 RepID=UPI0011AF14C3|nr:hypothetical protein [Ottowia massiliensis]
MSAKIRASCDTPGNLVKFVLMPGHQHDSKGVEELIRNPKFGALLADKAFDVQWPMERLQAQGVPIVISQRPNRRQLQGCDLSGFSCDPVSVVRFLTGPGTSGYGYGSLINPDSTGAFGRRVWPLGCPEKTMPVRSPRTFSPAGQRSSKMCL